MPVSNSAGSEGERLAGGVWFMGKRRKKEAEVFVLELGLGAVVVENWKIQSRNSQVGRENIAKT